MIKICSVCGGDKFKFQQVLWQELIEDWQLTPDEIGYVNRQQGFYCASCGNNLRSIALASAILKTYKFEGTLAKFVQTELAASLQVLEINEAGRLSDVLSNLPGHQLVSYPEYDMTRLSIPSRTMDLVIHSDTLEHIPHPIAALHECGRVLKTQGRCIYTVPIVVGRLTRSREGMKNSFHGSQETTNEGYIVRTEFGSDAWCYAAQAGFREIIIHNFEYPSALAIEVSNHG
jgi:SAM-dependent methyltransferase